jgi:hypothetical protein
VTVVRRTIRTRRRRRNGKGPTIAFWVGTTTQRARPRRSAEKTSPNVRQPSSVARLPHSRRAARSEYEPGAPW